MHMKVIDAVMGTGKSTWAIQQLKATQNRTIVVLPYRDEIRRYRDDLTGLENVVALHEDQHDKNKQQRFEDALEDAQVILITHQLFTDFLKPHIFQMIDQGEWHLLMDETVMAFEPIKALSKTILDGWLVNKIVKEEKVCEGLFRIAPVPGVTEMYTKADNGLCTSAEKKLLSRSLVHDLLMVDDNGERGFFAFALSEHRLKAFQSVTVLTYMFKDSDLDFWCRIKGLEVDHLELTRDGNTFHLQPHAGQYGGGQFRHLIEILDVRSNYGSQHTHLSAESSKKLVRGGDKIKEIQKDLKRHFRNDRKKIQVEPEDFMFCCREECQGLWKTNRLPAKFIGEDTWVAFNKRGINTLGHKHNLAFLYNVFPHLAVERVINKGMTDGTTYSREANALSTLLQWIWRSAIRNGEKIRVYVPSKRMREYLEDWLNEKCA